MGACVRKLESAPIQRHLNHFDRWSSMAVASTEAFTFFIFTAASHSQVDGCEIEPMFLYAKIG